MVSRPRHALITGGSRGIGLAIAQIFAKQGIRCTLISRSEEALKAAVATLQPLPAPTPSDTPAATSTPPQAIPSPNMPPLSPHTHGYIPGPVSHLLTLLPSPNAFTLALPRPSSTSIPSPSHIDILVNCAGISQSSLFLRTSDEEIDSIMTTNLTSLIRGTRFLLRERYLRLRRNEEDSSAYPTPSIINIASLLGVKGGWGAVAYSASKAGVLGFTRALATEYASHGVRVNAVVPGYIETGMTQDLDAEQLRRQIPLGRFGTAEEVAHAALFLADSEYAHNCVLSLDGGLSAV
jgi:NAD(P)-dependent dehydrogenase (short-subunit alcohol dehydrogenase family)